MCERRLAKPGPKAAPQEAEHNVTYFSPASPQKRARGLGDGVAGHTCLNCLNLYTYMKLPSLIIWLIILSVSFSAAAKKPEAKKNIAPAKSAVQSAKVDSAQIKKAAAPPEIIGEDVPVEKWVGKQFVCLKMPVLFQKFGYELYTTEKLGKETKLINSAVENKNHRLLYSRFVGTMLTAVTVTKPDSEYLVGFLADSGKTPVFARTHKMAIAGIAYVPDMALALQRWAGKEVFARRRHVSTYDSTKSQVAGFKVNIETPLIVTDVKWGLTPMPTQPLWVQVETPAHEKGFIGIFFSWTNVMADQVRPYHPFTEDILEENPRKQFDWKDDVWDQINTHNVATGMTRAQVLLAWDNPAHRDTIAVSGAKKERWTYPGQYVYFSGDTLISIENR
jgi:hypothetical protein